jgi:predicted N-formylglutamate amidohydrolase
MKKASDRLRQTILDVVDNQIRELNPPATKETFDRLVREGNDPDEARRLIGNVVASEIFDVLKNMEPYDEDRYVRALHRLPELARITT